jgi:diadenosine tetraphosphate (Ap4A) HIT family hydrolase
VSDAETAIHRQVAAARAGSDETVVARVASGWVVLGRVQVLPGYCLLLPDPVVADLNALGATGRERFLLDMAAVGDALLEVTRARRVNYAILGNLEPALHAHVVPRYADEPDAHRTDTPWSYDWSAAPPFVAERDAALKARIARALEARGMSRPRPIARALRLHVRPERLAIARLDAKSDVPPWASGPGFTSVTRTDEELSVVCPEERVPGGVTCSRGWRALSFDGPFALTETGVLASVTAPLAEARVSLFAVATFDTDHVLVHEDQLDDAIRALVGAGHRIEP